MFQVSPSATATEKEFTTGMVALVTEIAQALVDSPEEVKVETVPEQDGGTVLRLHVAPGDVGKIIGKQGRTARSLRTILSAAGMKLKHHFALDIVEEGELPEKG